MAKDLTVYEAMDGKRFDDKQKCESYEAGIIRSGIESRDSLLLEMKQAEGNKKKTYAPEFVAFVSQVPDKRAWDIMFSVKNARWDIYYSDYRDYDDGEEEDEDYDDEEDEDLDIDDEYDDLD